METGRGSFHAQLRLHVTAVHVEAFEAYARASTRTLRGGWKAGSWYGTWH
jgi:hypothetical protein